MLVTQSLFQNCEVQGGIVSICFLMTYLPPKYTESLRKGKL